MVIVGNVFVWCLIVGFDFVVVFKFGLFFYGDFVVVEFVFIFDVSFFCFFVSCFLSVILWEVVKFLECVCWEYKVLDGEWEEIDDYLDDIGLVMGCYDDENSW